MAGIDIARHSLRQGKRLAMSGLHKGSGNGEGGRKERKERKREREGTEWNAKLECEFLSSSDQPITTADDDDDELKGDT